MLKWDLLLLTPCSVSCLTEGKTWWCLYVHLFVSCECLYDWPYLQMACLYIQHWCHLVTYILVAYWLTTILNWIASYVCAWTMLLYSQWTFGVPQGSILGPFLFTLYQTPLGSICKKHGVTYLLYANNQHIYLLFKPIKKGSQEEWISRLENYIRETNEWKTNNLLKLNVDKTEFILQHTITATESQ